LFDPKAFFVPNIFFNIFFLTENLTQF